ncbi:MAG: hypothetical protein LBG59_08300 [Candidatus Peribacteria bacterium]|nr:hypothetical protein [Candidatus Peribacteria bacterium]
MDKETETLYTTHYLPVLQNEEYHLIGRALQKNGEGLDTIDGEGSTIETLTIDANGKLIYGKYKAEPGEYINDYTFTLLKEGGEILDSWTGNFLIYGSYKACPYEDGIAIGRTYSE